MDEQGQPAPRIEIPKRIEDSPEFWLGQIAEIVQLERSGKLGRSAAYTSIRDLMKRINQYQRGRQMEIRQLLSATAPKNV